MVGVRLRHLHRCFPIAFIDAASREMPIRGLAFSAPHIETRPRSLDAVVPAIGSTGITFKSPLTPADDVGATSQLWQASWEGYDVPVGGWNRGAASSQSVEPSASASTAGAVKKPGGPLPSPGDILRMNAGK